VGDIKVKFGAGSGKILKFRHVETSSCRSQWPPGQWRGSAAVRVLGLRVRIPPGGCLSLVSVLCCQVRVYASRRSLVQRSPTECGVSECDREASTMRRLWSTRDSCAMVGGRRPLVDTFQLLLFSGHLVNLRNKTRGKMSCHKHTRSP
jgi:hypothetical protein